MNEISILLDIALVAMSIWMVFIVTGYGGYIGMAFNMIGWGAVIMGVAHIMETITTHILGFNPSLVELLHRAVVLLGFTLIVLGFRKFISK